LTLAGGTVSATRYYRQAGATVAIRTPASLSYLAADHQGSEQLAVDAGSGAVSRQRALPFGADRGPATQLPGDRGFLGKVEDSSTGLDYLGARYYDPSIGRFLSPDPLADLANPQSLNPYSYALNNPVTHADPSGLRACSGSDVAEEGCAEAGASASVQ